MVYLRYFDRINYLLFCVWYTTDISSSTSLITHQPTTSILIIHTSHPTPPHHPRLASASLPRPFLFPPLQNPCDQADTCPSAAARAAHTRDRTDGWDDRAIAQRGGIRLPGRGCCRWDRFGWVLEICAGRGRGL